MANIKSTCYFFAQAIFLGIFKTWLFYILVSANYKCLI